MSEEEYGKGCFWVFAGLGVFVLCCCAGLAIMAMVHP